MSDDWPDLEYVNVHTLPCGCVFLIGWQESRIRHEDGLVDILEVVRYLDGDAAPQRRSRIVTQAEAEAIVKAKRNHEWWSTNTVASGTQPAPANSARHATLPYGDKTYAIVLGDQE